MNNSKSSVHRGFCVVLFMFCSCINIADADNISNLLQKESVVSGVGGQQALGKTLLDLSLSLPVSNTLDDNHYHAKTKVDNKQKEEKQNSSEKKRKIKNNVKKEIKNILPDDGKRPFYIASNTLSHGVTVDTNPAKNHWSIKRGNNLFNVLSEWTSDAGWSLIWKSDVSYQVLSTATFYGDFSSAVRQLFSSKGLDELNIYVKFYTGNKVLLVSSDPF